jgi:predicted transcriptional regulator
MNNRGSKRCIYDIVYDILLSMLTTHRGTKTRICRASNLPLDRCERVLELIKELGLAYSTNIGGREVYQLTDRGYQYIGVYEALIELLPTRRLNWKRYLLGGAGWVTP